MKKIILLGLVSILGGCSVAPIQLPNNVSTISASSAGDTYIDKIDYSFNSTGTSFSKLKLCAAENFQNDDIVLHDQAGSFIGAYTGRYYENNNTQVHQGKSVFKYLDENEKTFIANGNVKTKGQQAGLITDFVKYDVKVALKENKVQFVMSNILRAQQNTGTSSNNGFRQVGTWAGARAHGVIEALDGVAHKYQNCILAN